MVMQIKSWSAALLLTGLFIAPLSAQNIDPKLANALQHTLDSMRSVLNAASHDVGESTPPTGVRWAPYDSHRLRALTHDPEAATTLRHTHCQINNLAGLNP